ncbi:ankyrin-3 isoform X15 [Drosophila mauritiana]|uniref:Ankyrin-3 isoform X15 n=1 Tax=Drosophila mauritiana TaxID=7226 RepID=A0A6P8K6U2_DROMA|nr:ankyrin-3 isoform X15 [Drosophila mauritiana]
MAQFVTHIQPTLMEASQGHVPHHHGHQVGVQHSSHLPHSGHNMPSPPTHNHHHAHGHGHHTSSGGHHGGAGGHSQKQAAHHSTTSGTTSGHASKGQHHSPPSRIHSPPTEHHPDHIGHYEYFQHQHEQIFHHEGANGGASHKQQTHHHPNKHEHCPTGHQSAGDGNTSFLRAARAGNLERVLEHLKNNIDINTSNANGLNALHLASKDGHIHVVSELLRRGAIVDSATKKGNTALHIASLAGQEEVVKLLLEHNASVNVQSQNGFTPLYMAAQENHDAVVRLLLSNGANQSLATEDGFTPLAVAMQQGHDKVVAVLLESDTRGKVRLPALHIAAKKDDVKAATLLLDNDHNPDVTSKSGFTPLHIASHYGNQNIANLLIQKGADVNYSAKHNISPLHVAAKWGKTNMVSLLLEKGGNIEAKTRDGLTPLHCAARSGHEQVVDMLLERGAPISAKTKNGLAPLHMAAQGEHVDAARILLYHRAPVDEVTVDYLTALHVAAHCGHVRVAKLLLDRNADANARALNGFTPLHIACKKNRLKVVELLLRHGASISATTESGLTPLHVAAFMGCMNIVIYLLQHDASPDVPTVRGETPLHLAARANQTDIIRILLRNGAQVDARAREQQTPLHIASRLGNVDIVMLLLQHGAQVDATTKDMYTALHIAAKEGQDEVAAVLIDNGAALDAATKKGFTPLHLTAKYGHIKVAQLLLQKEADVDAQGKNGVTPLHVACHYNNQQVALLLLEKGASPHATAKNGHTPLHIAARKNQMDIATTLLEYGALANAESKAGFTPLHLSSQEGHAEISNLLIEHKAAVNHPAKNGLTPMHLCAQEDNVNVAEILEKNGANIDMATKAGYTPLHVASHFGQANMVRFLLQNGANVDAATSIGYTPLHQTAQQGHCHIVNLLLEHKANANAQTVNGQTPLHIARKLGYISVLDSLKTITKEDEAAAAPAQAEEKYRVVAPEAMHESFMSDSEEEGGEDNMLSDQPYRYLTVDEMKSLGDDSLPIDVTRDERMDSNRMTQSAEYASGVPPTIGEEVISPHKTQVYGSSPKATVDGVYIANGHDEPPHVGRKLSWKSFLVSFLVDARGGAMRGCRHSGVRMIIPSRSTCQPTRVTCRYVKPQRTMHPPQLMEGEALASRVLELGPCSTKFIGPVVMEVPHFASLRGKEREIIILRSDNGETWREHTIDNSEEIIHDVLQQCFEPEEIAQLEEQAGNHVCRFVTYDFPQYFAVVSRIRQEVHAIGPEGGMVSSTVVPQVQAVFPQGALTKKIKVGLQAQPVDPDLTAKLLGRGVAVSPIVTVEPRRRKFHKAITLSMPAPKAHSQGMINQYSGNTPTLRLLCSITGGPSRAQWEDVTGSTPLTFVNDCVSFTTTVSARFWLMDCRNISDATKMATELYKEVIHVPFIAKFVVFAKKVEPFEARLRVFCMTDDREDKTLEKHELYTEVAKSRDVEVLEGKPQYIEMAGNLVPVTKSGDQLQVQFKAFRENRLPFTVRVKDQHADIVGRTLFMKEPKVAKGEPPQQPICILNIVLPEAVIPDSTTAFSDRVTSAYRTSMFSLSKHQNDHYIGDIRIVDLSNLLGKDWIQLAPEIGINGEEIDEIINQNTDSIARQAQSMIRLYKDKPNYDILSLETALKNIGRDDIMKKCKSGRLSHSREFDEADLMKNSESVEELVRREILPLGKRIQQINEREEVKYSAEEKEVEESESDEEAAKRTVAERREKIVKRLSIERSIPASTQKKEITREITEIKRKSLIEDKKAHHESEILMQLPADNVIIKTTTVPDQVIKMKMGKMDSTEVSKSEFDKELTHKFKTSGRSSEEEDQPSSPDQTDKIVQDISAAEKKEKDGVTFSRVTTITRQEARDITEDFLEIEKRSQLPATSTTATVHEKFVEEIKEKTSPLASVPQETVKEVQQVISEVTEIASKKVENIISSFESSKSVDATPVLPTQPSVESSKVSETIKNLEDSKAVTAEQVKTVQVIESSSIEETIAEFEAKKVKYDFHGGEPKTQIPKFTRKPSDDSMKPTAAPRATVESETESVIEAKVEKPISKIPVKTIPTEAQKVSEVDARKITQDFLQGEKLAAEPKPSPAASKIPKVEPRKSVDKQVDRESKVLDDVVASTATIMTAGLGGEQLKDQLVDHSEIIAKSETVAEKVTELLDTFHKIEEKVTKSEKTSEISSKVEELVKIEDKPLLQVQPKEDKVAQKVAEVIDTFHKIEEQITTADARQLTRDFLSMEKQNQLPSMPQAAEKPLESSLTSTSASEPESIVTVKPSPPASKIPVVEPRKIVFDESTKPLIEPEPVKTTEKKPLNERQLTADFLSMEQQTQLVSEPAKSLVEEVMKSAEQMVEQPKQQKPLNERQITEDFLLMEQQTQLPSDIVKPTDKLIDGIESAAPVGDEASPFHTPKLTTSVVTQEPQQLASEYDSDTFGKQATMPLGDSKMDQGLTAPVSMEPRKSLTDAEFCKSVGETITKKMSVGVIEISDELKKIESEIPHSQTPPPTPSDNKTDKQNEEPELISLERDYLADTVTTLHTTTESTLERVSAITKIETLQERKVDLSSLDTAKISHEIAH